MKISLLTMHGVYNYGSALQTYATITALQRLGHEVEILNYYPKRMKGYGSIQQLYTDAIAFHPKWKSAVIALLKYSSMVSLKKVFTPFFEKYYKLSRKYESNNELMSDTPIADCYFTGSDQVWNDYLEGGFDRAYFLDFAPKGAIKIALSASFGRDDITPEELEPVADLLREYLAISVREESGLKTLSRVQVPTKKGLLDPTFLLTADEWRALSSPINESGYILLYQLHEDSIASKVASVIGEKRGISVIRISTNKIKKVKSGKTVFAPTVEQFVSYIDNASLVVTDSFHATAFSVNLGVSFVSIQWKMFNDRIGTVLRASGLSNRMVKTVDEALKIECEPINYEDVAGRINKKRKEIWAFLSQLER